jgi:steroid delta-isomerase-like uncharacterized protein
MPDNAAQVLSLFEAWEKRDFDALMALMADGVTVNDVPRGQVITDRAAVKDWFASWASACPDSVAGISVVAASGDTVAAEGVYAGTNTGAFGPLPSAGRSVSMPFANVIRFDADGRVTNFTGYYDQVTIMTQLGHMAPADAG